MVLHVIPATERYLPAEDVLPGHDPATLRQHAADISWLASMLRGVAAHKEHDTAVNEELKDKLLMTAHDVREWLGQMLDAEQLCRSGSGSAHVDGFITKGE